MLKAAGIIGLIGAILGFFAAIFTLMAGGLVGGLESVSSELSGEASTGAGQTIVGMGFLGLLGSFVAIVTSAMLFSAKKRTAPIILLVSSIIAAIAGGTFVAVCMVLCIIAGIIGIMGVGKS
tara:strand:+ start:82 stop:447 length:366 start_codon:yes stop_codon:yes gene_type:complete